MKTQLILLAAFFVVGLAACQTTTESNVETITGSGNIITEERDVTSFSRIQIFLGADLDLTQGESNSLRIEADDNFMQYINVEVKGGELIVTKPDDINLSPSQTIQLYVGFSTLRSIEVFGRSAITGENLDLDSLDISFSGAGSTSLTGTIATQTISIQGEAFINNFEVTSRRVSVDVSGGGTINVYAQDELNVTVAGRATVRYLGDPVVSQRGSGSIDVAHQQ